MRLSRSLLLVVVVTFLAWPAADAQEDHSVRYAASVGITFRSVDATVPAEDPGFHLQLSAAKWLSDALGVRADLSAHGFPGRASAIAGCPPEGSCPDWNSLAYAFGFATSLAARPVPTSSFALLAGPGVYWASDGGRRSHTALSLIGGAAFGGLPSSRLIADVRAHYFPSGLAEIRWLVTPSIGIAF